MAKGKTVGALHAGSIRWNLERLKVGEYLYIHTDNPKTVASSLHTIYRNHEEKSLNKHGLETEMILVTPVLMKGGSVVTEKIVRVRRTHADPYLK